MTQDAKTHWLVAEIEATTTTISRHQDDENFHVYALGALRGMLQGMAGLHDFATHPSVFPVEAVEAIKALTSAIERK